MPKSTPAPILVARGTFPSIAAAIYEAQRRQLATTATKANTLGKAALLALLVVAAAAGCKPCQLVTPAPPRAFQDPQPAAPASSPTDFKG